MLSFSFLLSKLICVFQWHKIGFIFYFLYQFMEKAIYTYYFMRSLIEREV